MRALIVAALIAAANPQPARLPASVVAYWQRLHACEEPGAWFQRGTQYVSGLGIYAPNWYRWAPRVGVTTAPWFTSPYNQMRVADYGWRHERAWWGCFAEVGTPP